MKLRFVIEGFIILCSVNISPAQDLHAGLAQAVSIQSNGRPQGTGLYYQSDSFLYLVTAAHVLFQLDRFENLTDQLRFKSIKLISYDKEKRSIELDVDLSVKSQIKRHKSKDICVLVIGKVRETIDSTKYSIGTPSYVKIIKTHTDINGLLMKKSIHMDKLMQGEELRIFGYPTSLDSKRNGKSFYEFDYPLLQSGIISGLSLSLGNIIIYGAIFHGNSGGPVLRKNVITKSHLNNTLVITQYELIGIVSELVPFALENHEKKYDYSNSGYSIIIPIHFADELIRKLESSN